MSWTDVLRDPLPSDHIVQTYQDPEFLADAVAEYLGTGLRRGEAAIVIARPQHVAKFEEKIGATASRGQLIILDAEDTLARLMAGAMPQWNAFREIIGGAIAEARLQYPAVRAYGEMVDILWQQSRREAAIRLEEYWNELTRLQTFSLFCAYAMDHLDAAGYSGLEAVCRTHTHFIPTRDEGWLNQAVSTASAKVLDAPLARLLLSLAANHQTSTKMPSGQAALLWLSQNMPRTADRVLREVKEATRAS